MIVTGDTWQRLLVTPERAFFHPKVHHRMTGLIFDWRSYQFVFRSPLSYAIDENVLAICTSKALERIKWATEYTMRLTEFDPEDMYKDYPVTSGQVQDDDFVETMTKFKLLCENKLHPSEQHHLVIWDETCEHITRNRLDVCDGTSYGVLIAFRRRRGRLEQRHYLVQEEYIAENGQHFYFIKRHLF